MGDEPSPLENKLETLNQQLESVKSSLPSSENKGALSGDAARAAVDFASASAMGSLLGYGVDCWLNSMPWGLLAGLILGTAAGVKLMFQAEEKRQKTEAHQNQPTSSDVSK